MRSSRSSPSADGPGTMSALFKSRDSKRRSMLPRAVRRRWMWAYLSLQYPRVLDRVNIDLESKSAMSLGTNPKANLPAGDPPLHLLTAASKQRRLSGGSGLQGKSVWSQDKKKDVPSK